MTKLRKNLIGWTAEVAANWWANLLEKGDKAAFKGYLEQAIVARLLERHMCIVECDYDPKDILLEAVRAAGVECSGKACSAEGILPWKTDMIIRPGSIQPCSRSVKSTGMILIAQDVGYKDSTVTVVAQFRGDEFKVLSITEE